MDQNKVVPARHGPLSEHGQLGEARPSQSKGVVDGFEFDEPAAPATPIEVVGRLGRQSPTGGTRIRHSVPREVGSAVPLLEHALDHDLRFLPRFLRGDGFPPF